MALNPHDDAQEDLSTVWGSLRRMVRQLMISRKDPEDTQRHRLFRTRCRVQGNLCDLIIDGDSQENVISRKAVQKLKLTPSPHPEPYDIGWVTNASEIRVTERCKVPFSIGKYSDEHYCDIVYMDACEILLGRPWQFDMDATYSGRQNIYRFMKEGVKYKLVPLGEKKDTTREAHASVLKIEHDKTTIWSDMKEAKFAYNNAVHQTTGKSPFTIGYTKAPNVALDLVKIPKVEHVAPGAVKLTQEVAAMHNEEKKNIEVANTKYKTHVNARRRKHVFNQGDGVMVFLSNSRIIGGHQKLQPQKI